MLEKKELLYIEETALSLSGWCIRHRRNLHQIPETAWKETKTTAYLESELRRLGYRVVSGSSAAGKETGLIAELSTASAPVAVLRFDIDALAVPETDRPSHFPAASDFSSRHNGYMHACGHDGHMAIGLTAARILAENQDLFHGTIRLIFQPAEEGCMGAAEIVKQGWLDDAEYFLAGHIVGREYGGSNGEPVDCITGVKGSLATTKINVRFNGHSCHGACPEYGASAISALCSSVLALNGIPRNSKGATMINVGKISGGEGRNIVAGEASMELEVRGDTTELNQYMEDLALERIEGAAKLWGCTADITICGKAPSLVTSHDFHQYLNRLLCSFSSIKISPEGERFRASEDAAVMMEKVKSRGGQAAFMLFPTDTTAPLHSRDYDFNEEILPRAAALFCSAVMGVLK